MLDRSSPARFMLLAAIALCGQSASAASTTVNALLQDPSTDPAIRSERIVLDRHSVAAGKVTFHAVNQSKELVHELLVIRLKRPQAVLPYDEGKSEVVESRVEVLGEIDELQPGASGTMTVDLKAGPYILVCNQPGHYKAGMHTKFSVTP